MNYVIKVVSLRTESKVLEHRFEAPSEKEAKVYMENFLKNTWFKNRDVSFSLWVQKPGEFSYEGV